MVTPKISLFNFLIILFLLAGFVVFYVNNIIKVNNLVTENNNIYGEINKTVSINNQLQTGIERLSGLDNIKGVAIDKLKLTYSPFKSKKIFIKKSDLGIITQ